MGAFSVNGSLLLYECRLVIPRVGNWTADIACQTGGLTALTSPVTLNMGDLSLTGYAVHSGTTNGAMFATLAGGAGGLGKRLTARAYRNVALAVVVRDLLAEVGEQLAPDADPTGLLTSTIVPQWVRFAQRASSQLSAVADAIGAMWRVEPGGGIWIGIDTWAVTTLTGATHMADEPEVGKRTFGVLSPALLPGTTLYGTKVSTVEHIATRDGIRTIAWSGP